ncbi:MAG: efflux RND transporter permease subunit [Candidatus Cryptobacteroides sp.]
MKLRIFIERPVLSAVISIVILLAGIIGLASLPVEQYPNIAPPTVMVSTSYPGANAQTIQKSVIAPLEESINGVENMDYMKSTSTNTGKVQIQVVFHQGTDPDMAAVFVQNRVSQATASLPAEVTRVGVSVLKRQSSMIKVLGFHSPNNTYDNKFIANYVKLNIEPQLKRIQGVGDVALLSDQYAMRIWFNPDAMMQHNLIPDDVTAVLAEQNIEAATGAFGETSTAAYEYTMKYSGRLQTPEEFGEIVISASPDGQILRLKDVARIELGTESYGYMSSNNGHNGVEMLVFQIAGSNASQVVNEIDAMLEDASGDFPEDLEYTSLMSVNDFLYASIKEVIKSLILAILLVVLVVWFFLQDFRATLVPTVSIIVSIVGTFAFMAVAGFTLNLLTLFALVLAIGTVVDNSIVVVEAVQSKFENGYMSPYHATVDAMGGVTSAIVTATIVFMAVFIPVSMTGGTSGVFYTQFGITMAVAVGISAINALTLSPALCALLLKPYKTEDGQDIDNFSNRFRRNFTTGFNAVVGKYKKLVIFFIHHKLVSGIIVAACIALLVVLMTSTKTGLVPDEDMGVVMVDLSMPAGTSLHRTDEYVKEISARLQTIPEAKVVSAVAGYGLISGQGSCYGKMTLKLKDWKYRKHDDQKVQAVIGKVKALTADLKDVQVIPMAPPMINGYGTSNGFEFNLQDKNDREIGEFYQVAQDFLAELNRRPEIAGAYTGFSPNFPQYMVDVDAARCKMAGVSPATVLSTISGYYGGQYVSNINRFSHVYRVTIQADPQYRMTPQSLESTYVRTNSGQMAPLSQFVTLTKVYGAQTLSRFNMYNSIGVTGSPAEGYSSGDAIKAIAEVAATSLPKGYTYEFAGLAREEQKSAGNSMSVYFICIVLIYLILCAFYESFLIPLAIIISVPCGVMGSFLFAKLFGLENNIYLQTGIIMLIGLLSKTAILITEYASKRRKAGMSINQAAVGAAKARLRPILMTALTMIFGMLPLMFSNGVGANGNSSLGTGAVGGMLVGTLVLVFLVPALFCVFQTLQEKIHPVQFENPDWHIQNEMEEVKQLKQAKEQK